MIVGEFDLLGKFKAYKELFAKNCLFFPATINTAECVIQEEITFSRDNSL